MMRSTAIRALILATAVFGAAAASAYGPELNWICTPQSLI